MDTSAACGAYVVLEPKQIFAELVLFFVFAAKNEVHDMGWKERPAVSSDWNLRCQKRHVRHVFAIV